jgi:MOSC domain-containing protein YiiM
LQKRSVTTGCTRPIGARQCAPKPPDDKPGSFAFHISEAAVHGLRRTGHDLPFVPTSDGGRSAGRSRHQNARMKTVRDLSKPPQINGRVEAIVVRGSPREVARTVESTVALAGVGLEDDRLGQRGEPELSTRQVTLIQAEHLEVIARLARVDRVDPVGLRRNLVVSGINLLALRNARLQVGDALLEIVGPCQPCSRMEETIGPGGYAAMRGHGGMTARVITTGSIRLGDVVRAQP